LGRPYEAAHGSIRFTLGKHTTQKDLKYLVSKLPDIVEHLRKASPVDVDMDTLDKSIKTFPREITEL
jgi:cysteine desulfurase